MMATPAVDLTVQRQGVSPGEILRWWGEWQPATFYTTFVDLRQKRPASITNVKGDDGQWPRSGWHHFWFRSGGIPVGYTFTLNNTSGSNLAGARSSTDTIVQLGPFSLSQLAPWLVSPTASRTPELWNLENTVRTRLLNRLREENVDLGVALGEINQTAGFLADVCHATLDGVTAARRRAGATVRDMRYWLWNGFSKTPPWHRRKGRNAEQRVKAMAGKARDLWLQGQFAVKPLIGDVRDAAASLDKYVNGGVVPDTRVTVRAGVSTVRYGELILAHSSYGGYFNYPVPVAVTSEVHGSCDYRVPVTFARTFESLGLGNPAALAHELIPFSWMFDYLVGMGSWLSSLSADRDATFLDGSLSYVQRLATTTSSVTQRVRPGAVVVSNSQAAIRLQLDAGRFERNVVSGAFLPAILPPVKNRLNLTRMANSVFALTKSYGPNLRI